MQNKILILNGPNLNLLGEREKSIYGSSTLPDIYERCKREAESFDFLLDFVQSNNEGELIDCIQELMTDKYQGLIINGGAYSHSSYAIMDALLSIPSTKPIIELHISNIAKRESFRHNSYISRAASGVIYGFGVKGYELAVIAINKILSEN